MIRIQALRNAACTIVITIIYDTLLSINLPPNRSDLRLLPTLFTLDEALRVYSTVKAAT